MTVSAWQRYLKSKRFQYSSVIMSCDKGSLSYALVFNRKLQPILTITDCRMVPNKKERLKGHKAINRLIEDGIKPADMTVFHNERTVERLIN